MLTKKLAWTLGIGLASIAWVVLMEYLRYRSWRKHRGSGFTRGTQHLSIAATIGMALGLTGVLLILLFA
jgi:hypothetical protein